MGGGSYWGFCPDLLEVLTNAELLGSEHRQAVGGLRRSAENRAVQIPGVHRPVDNVVTLLAAGFALSEPGAPTIPYAQLETDA